MNEARLYSMVFLSAALSTGQGTVSEVALWIMAAAWFIASQYVK